MAQPLTPPYLVGLLYTLSRRHAELTARLAPRLAAAAAAQDALDLAALALGLTQTEQQRLKGELQQQARDIGDGNGRLANLHREAAVLQRRVDTLRVTMLAAAGIEQQQLRRSRAGVQLQLKALRGRQVQEEEALASLHAAQVAAQRVQVLTIDRARQQGASLDDLQAQLPAPELYLEQFMLGAAQAHCRMALDQAPQAWRLAVLQALVPMQALHRAVHTGHYRLDQNSALLGGRHPAVAEAVYAALAAGAATEARTLFEQSCDPTRLFHHILPVFRLWCVGLSLQGRFAELLPLVRTHRYADGLRGAYANVFLALCQRDAERWPRALQRLVQLEGRLASSLPEPALAVICVAGLALAHWGQQAQLPLPELGPTVPLGLLQLATAPLPRA